MKAGKADALVVINKSPDRLQLYDFLNLYWNLIFYLPSYKST